MSLTPYLPVDHSRHIVKGHSPDKDLDEEGAKEGAYGVRIPGAHVHYNQVGTAPVWYPLGSVLGRVCRQWVCPVLEGRDKMAEKMRKERSEAKEGNEPSNRETAAGMTTFLLQKETPTVTSS